MAMAAPTSTSPIDPRRDSRALLHCTHTVVFTVAAPLFCQINSRLSLAEDGVDLNCQSRPRYVAREREIHTALNNTSRRKALFMVQISRREA